MGTRTIVKTGQNIITVTGKVFYNDRRRRIDLKKPVKELLNNTRGSIEYVMELCVNKEQAIHRVEKLSEQKTTPVLLYFTNEEEDPDALL